MVLCDFVERLKFRLRIGMGAIMVDEGLGVLTCEVLQAAAGLSVVVLSGPGNKGFGRFLDPSFEKDHPEHGEFRSLPEAKPVSLRPFRKFRGG